MSYIIHLRVETGSLGMAQAFAIQVVDNMHKLMPELDVVSTTVSDEGRQNDRHWVLCGDRLRGDDRCLRPYHHRVITLPTGRSHEERAGGNSVTALLSRRRLGDRRYCGEPIQQRLAKG